MSSSPLKDPQRRRFLQQSAGISLVLGFSTAGMAQPVAVNETAPSSAGVAPAWTPNAWLAIDGLGAVEVRISKTEMGQGTETGLAMIVADELDADWAQVSVRTIRPDGRVFMITGGSYSISSSWIPARNAAAAAREMLRHAAAAAWGVPASDCRTEAHAVLHPSTGRGLPYGQLVAAAAALPVPAAPPLKDPSQYRLIGSELPAKNLDAIVRGQARYGIDQRVPGMLYAVVARAPAVNGRLAAVDDAAARAVPGVVAVVRLRGNRFPGTDPYVRDGVAVVARSTWAALQGRERLQTRWQLAPSERKATNGALASSAALDDDFRRALAGTATEQAPDSLHGPVTVTRRGSTEGMERAFAQAHRVLEAEYALPLQAHAPMEPVNAVAHWQPDRCEIWAGTHFQSRTHSRVRAITALPADRIVVHTPLLGGSFGRRLEPDFVIEAVMLSRELERPVQVLWTRDDDLREGLLAPPSRHRVRVALAADGRILALDHAFAALSVRQQTEPQNITPQGLDHTVGFDAVKFPYAADTLHVSHRLVEQAIRVLWWRRGYTPNHWFVTESLMDECAAALGQDPLAYRLKLLEPGRVIEHDNEGEPERVDTARLARTLRAAADAAGWGRAMPTGTGLGLAATVTDSHLAQVVEVDTRGGGIRVVRVVCAVDCGRVINPQLVKAQVEGSIVFALTAALKGKITVEAGQVQQRNFSDYPLLRIDEMPEVVTVLLPSDAPPTGMGEQASHATMPALANALAAATGRRWREPPFVAASGV
jgi:isoquinoline 1-oxidoreductase beta subunit